MSKRCWACGGTGDIMGMGMIAKDCHVCDGFGTINESKVKVNEPVVVDRSSKSYKEAIAKIMKLNPKYSRDDAIKIFDSEFDKIA